MRLRWGDPAGSVLLDPSGKHVIEALVWLILLDRDKGDIRGAEDLVKKKNSYLLFMDA